MRLLKQYPPLKACTAQGLLSLQKGWKETVHYSSLVEMKIYNIITSSDYEGIKQEMIECISPEGKDLKSVLKNKYFLNDEKDSKALTFLCKDIKIAVVGVERRAGTTTVAFNLTNFLSQAGADISYVEANTHGHLSTLPIFFKDMIVHESFIEYKKLNTI